MWNVVIFLSAWCAWVLLCCHAVEVHARSGFVPALAPYSFAAFAASFDLDAKEPLNALGHFNFNATNPQFIPDVKAYTPNTWNILDSSVRRPNEEYVVLVDDGSSNGSLQVINMQSATMSSLVASYCSISNLHCEHYTNTTNLCYAVDIEGSRFVTVDPMTGICTTVFTYTGYVGLIEDASAFDWKNRHMYVVFDNENNENKLLVADLHKHVIRDLSTTSFGANNTGPFCFDYKLGLVGLGSPLATIAAMDPLTLQSKHALDCNNGLLAVSLIDFYPPTESPTLLVGFDFNTQEEGGTVFLNSTIVEIHQLHLADPENARR